MAETNISKKSATGSKKPDLPKTDGPKSEAAKPEASKPEAPKAENPSTESAKVEKSEVKTDAPPKSLSQSSISHFSSVSTPEYRSGWDKIFSGGEATERLGADQNTLPRKIEIADQDITLDFRQTLDEKIESLLKSQGYDLNKEKSSILFEYTISCVINHK